jgi:hypothetical protein
MQDFPRREKRRERERARERDRSAMQVFPPIPVTVLSGFLGAGKTTLMKVR